MTEARPLDTEAAVWDLQIESWRGLSMAERAALIDQMCSDVELLARAGIRRVNPALSESEALYQLARRRYGSSLADAAYPGAAHR
ncbi:hypothetical protein BH23ACT2_BH23ACT2_27800 [soil metagenome]